MFNGNIKSVISKIGLILAGLLSAPSAFANQTTLSCVGTVQPGGPGHPVTRVEMLQIASSETSVRLSGTYSEYIFQVQWDRALTTLYMEIKERDTRVLFSTARVPTPDHNDSMADVTLPGPLRLYLSCDFIEYRPTQTK